MKSRFPIIFIGFCLSMVVSTRLFTQTLMMPADDGFSPGIDTVSLGTFESLRDMHSLIDDYFGFPEELQVASNTILPQAQTDSIFELLNRTHQVVVPSTLLPIFYDFVLPEQKVDTRIQQRLILLPKDKELRFNVEIQSGDAFSFKFEPDKGFLNGASLELLFNSVQVSAEQKLKNNTGQTLDFVADRDGTVELIFRNFGYFKLEGDLTVQVKPRPLNLKLEEFSEVVRGGEEQLLTVSDTIFKTLYDGPLVLSNVLNLRENSVIEKKLAFDSTQNLLGFAVFLYPSSQKEQLEIQRRSVLREDPLQDFAIKELNRKEYTYLPEFYFEDLQFLIFDPLNTIYWMNGTQRIGERFRISQNSKRNYAFFKKLEGTENNPVYLRISNKSTLYNRELELQMLALVEEKFQVLELVEEHETKKYIIVTLL